MADDGTVRRRSCPIDGLGNGLGHELVVATLVAETKAPLAPVDLRVMLVQPRHSEDGVVPDERDRHEVDRVGVRADTDVRRSNDRASGDASAVRESDELGRGDGRGDELMFGYEADIDELVGRAAIHEEYGGVTFDESIELDEATRMGDELVNLTRRRRVAGVRWMLPCECREPIGE